MDLIRTSIDKPVAVVVGIILVLLFGVLAATRIPIQLTPNVETTVITVTTRWEGASPAEVEQDVVHRQEEKLKGLNNLRKMTSESREGSGQITLTFEIGTDRDAALAQVSDRLREVTGYPENMDEPVVRASDPQDRDYIAWIMLEADDADFQVRTLRDFAENWIKPRLERVEGMSTINVLGGWQREAQVRVDPMRMAQLGVSWGQLVDALRRENVDLSAGSVDEGKSGVTVRTVGRFRDVGEIEQIVIERDGGGPVRIGDIGAAVLTYKKPESFVRSKGQDVISMNAQRELGTNVIEVMAGLKAAIAELNEPGGLLDAESARLGLSSPLRLRQTYDATVYIEEAIGLVRTNIFIGGTIAVLVLLVFLRSLRSVGIIALAIPISVIGTFVAMVAMGRNLNVISLAGLAFAVGMVVDASVVVLENIYRHMEMGAKAHEAALRATKEVWGAILASTLTTIIVFIPILFIEEDAGQLFRDIALAICAAVALSLIVSITVVPCVARYWLSFGDRGSESGAEASRHRAVEASRPTAIRESRKPSVLLSRAIYALCGSVTARVAIVLVLAGGAVLGSVLLAPPSDYLPRGNRNMVFGMLIPPPGYNLDKKLELSKRVEDVIRPFWEAGELIDDPEAYRRAVANLPEIPAVDPITGQPYTVVPPTIDHYFFVSTSRGFIFHGGVSQDSKRVVDLATLFNHSTRQENLPGVTGMAFQSPLFRLSGASGSSIDIEFSGADIDQVIGSADAAQQILAPQYGWGSVRGNPGNFNLPAQEVQVIVDRLRAAELGLTTRDIGLAVRALGDGAIVGEYRLGSESIDLKVVDADAVNGMGYVPRDLDMLREVPIATPGGRIVPLGSVASLLRTTAPPQINRVEQRRAVTLEFTPPRGMPLAEAMEKVDTLVADLRADGRIPPTVAVNLAGSADKLTAVRHALFGDGTLIGLLGSGFFLALLISYLLMCVLFDSFLYPFVILITVPVATFGGFVGLRIVHDWTLSNPYMPTQNLDILTMLGFVILMGVVVNNAILLVHQSLNFMRGRAESGREQEHGLPARAKHDDLITQPVSRSSGEPPASSPQSFSHGLEAHAPGMPPRRAIAEAVRTRFRPILMTSLTTVGGTLPLVLMPGSGSELYRGLGSVVMGGLLLSMIFTLVLVPLLLSLALDAKAGTAAAVGAVRTWRRRRRQGIKASGHQGPGRRPQAASRKPPSAEPRPAPRRPVDQEAPEPAAAQARLRQ